MLPREPIYAEPSAEDPEEELYARRLARDNFLHFASYTFSHFVVDPLQLVLGYYLQKVLTDEIDRLMVFAPPQHGKSESVSIRFPAYWFAKRPDDPAILCSYGSGHAYDKVFSVRQVIEGNRYRALFPSTSISTRTRGGSNWRIKNHKGGMVSAGVGGPITGYGARLGIIDDPFKNYQEAESTIIREKVWNWYQTTFRTRIWENGKIILVMTRWHEDDLAGRLLNQQSEKWTVIRLPALAETQDERDKNNAYLGLKEQIGKPDPAKRAAGEALCPGRFNVKALMNLKTDVGPIAWTGQYMGVPRAPEGNLIKRAWLHIISLAEAMEMAAGMVFVRFWDKAATEGGGCRSCGLLMGRDQLRRYVIFDVTKGQWSTLHREKLIRTVAENDYKTFGHAVQIWLEEEPGSGGKDSSRASVSNLEGFAVKVERPSGSKLSRLGPFIGQAEAGNVYMVKADWNWDYLEELAAIPNNTFWDQADSTSGAFNKLAITGWSRGPKQ